MDAMLHALLHQSLLLERGRERERGGRGRERERETGREGGSGDGCDKDLDGIKSFNTSRLL